jgi:tetratricopeptide (TPR) repeat protein
LLEDYRIAKHTHNDFMEMAAETGVAGGAAYIVLFGLLLFILVRTMNRNRAGGRQDANLVVLALLTSLLMYIIDAFLNFPGERPCNQVNLAIAIGLIATLPTAFFKQPTKTTSKFILPLMGAVGLLLVFTSGLIYKSMRMQGMISSDYWQQSPRLGPDFVASGLGSFPDLTELCLPVNYIKARYYLLGNRENEGFNILYNDKNPNPAIGLREGLLAEYWASKAKYDSSLPYAKISVDKLPLCRSYMRVLAYGCIALKDSMALRKYFPPIIKATYGTKAVGNWRNYAAAYYECTGNKTATTAIIDSALAAFPAQPYLLKYKNVLKDFVPGGKPADTAPAQQPASPDDVAYQKLQTKAKEFFKAQKYDQAMACFRQAASLKPKEYSNYENMGLLCLVKKEYAQSGIYFKKVIDAKAFENGKSEYYYAGMLQLLLPEVSPVHRN